MTESRLEMARVVLFHATPEQCLAATRRAATYNFEFHSAESIDTLSTQLISPSRSVLVLGSLAPEVWPAVKKIRSAKSGFKTLPVFAFVPDAKIDSKILKKANEFQVQILPESIPEGRCWHALQLANEQVKNGKRRFVVNRRAHFRLPLRVKAKVIAETETVDISLGGLAFLCNRLYRVGEKATIDIRSLLGDSSEEQRGFQFEIVSVKKSKEKDFKYLVGAKFVNLAETAAKRLRDALELIEPTRPESGPK